MIPPSPDNSPVISVYDRGLQLGDGVFDTLISLGGRPFLLDRHIERLIRHAAVIGLHIQREPVVETVKALLAETGHSNTIIRLTLTRGQAARGLWPSGEIAPGLIATCSPWSQDLVGQPARMIMASIPRNQHSPLSRIKSLAYLENILAAREAAEAGCDDALIVNLAGHAVSSTIANIFAFYDKTLLTPPLEDGCLDGIMRGLVIEEANAMGLTCRELSLTPQRLEQINCAFVTNSVRLLRPVIAIGSRKLTVMPEIAELLAHIVSRIKDETGTALHKHDYLSHWVSHL